MLREMKGLARATLRTALTAQHPLECREAHLGFISSVASNPSKSPDECLNYGFLGSTLEVLTQQTWGGAQASIILGSSPGDPDKQPV